MDLLAHLRQTLDWNAWANRQVLNTLQGVAQPPAKAVRIFAHIVGAERLWLSRIHFGRKPDAWPHVWPELSLDECAPAVDELAQHWNQLLDSMTSADLERPNDYVNSKGEPWSSTIGQIITHVTHHSSYHRGQIATLLGSAGHAPAYTDYIHAVRQGLLGA